MGLWNKKSLLFLSEIFPIEVVGCDFEPLQDYHFKYFYDTLKSYYAKDKSLHGRIYHKGFAISFPFNLYLFSRVKKAFTIQVIYRKK